MNRSLPPMPGNAPPAMPIVGADVGAGVAVMPGVPTRTGSGVPEKAPQWRPQREPQPQ